MVRGRTMVLVLFMVAAAIGVAVGTGAFSTVSAQRTVDVSTAGDDSALLQVEVHNGPNGAYAQASDGELEILLNGGLSSASGVNLNALTTINDVFNVTNQGSQDVGVWIVMSGPHSDLITFKTDSGDLTNSSASAQSVPIGGTLEVSIVIDTRGASLSAGDTLLDSITIHADAAEA